MVNENDYAAGFEQGFRSVAGSMAVLPILPIQPVTPIGKTPFQVGIQKGIEAANRRRGR
jgi:hypothetical protein